MSELVKSALSILPPDLNLFDPNRRPPAPTPKKWTREAYYLLGEQGWFTEKRVELIDGEIIELERQTPRHAYSVDVVRSLLNDSFRSDCWTRLKGPFPQDPWHEPEPDVSVAPGVMEEFEDHPTEMVLVVEIAEQSSLEYDTQVKSNLYASMGVPDYWVLDLENRQLLVHRQPVADQSVPFGHRYEKVETIAADGHISPLEKPDGKLAVADMLPPKK